MTVLLTQLDRVRAADYDGMYREIDRPNYWAPDIAVVQMNRMMRPGGLVCDLAAGAGRHSLHLAASGRMVTAIDYSPCGVEKITELARMAGLDGLIDARHADVRDQLPDERFDGVVMSLMFQYLTASEADSLHRWAIDHTFTGGMHALTFYLDDGDPRGDEYADGFIPVDPTEVTGRYIADGWELCDDGRNYQWGVPVYSAVLRCPGG